MEIKFVKYKLSRESVFGKNNTGYRPMHPPEIDLITKVFKKIIGLYEHLPKELSEISSELESSIQSVLNCPHSQNYSDSVFIQFIDKGYSLGYQLSGELSIYRSYGDWKWGVTKYQYSSGSEDRDDSNYYLSPTNCLIEDLINDLEYSYLNK